MAEEKKKPIKRKDPNRGRRTAKDKTEKRVFVIREAEEIYKAKLKENILRQTSMGYTEKKIAELNGISDRFIRKLMQKDPAFKAEFFEVRDNAKDIRIVQVEDALFRRAIGMNIKKEMAFKSKGEPIEKTEVTEELPPDVRAAEFFLATQASKKWNPKTVVSHEGSIQNDIVIYELPDNARLSRVVKETEKDDEE